MSMYKGLVGGAAALCAVGLVLRIAGVPWGTEVMILALFGAVIALVLSQRTTQNLVSTTRRNLTVRLKEIDEAQAREHDAIDELTSLQRTTLWYVKNRPQGAPAPVEAVAGRSRRPHRSGTAGRSSTPEVTNDSADISFTTALDPRRPSIVAGVLASRTREVLPEGTRVEQFLPGRALESLETVERPALIVVDEAAFEESPWDRAVGPTGTATMRDLLAALQGAREAGISAVIVPFRGVPDVHSAVLHSSGAVRLPLPDQLREQASGAPLPAVLTALDALASGGKSA